MLLVKLDFTYHNTLITPFNVVSIPYLAIVTLSYVLGKPLNFYTPCAESVVVWIIGLFLFWTFGSYMNHLLFFDNANTFKSPLKGQVTFTPQKYILFLAWITIVASIYGLNKSLSAVGGWQYIGSDEFSSVYGTGWYAHFRILSMPILIYFIGHINKKNVSMLITIFIMLIMIALYQVKAWIFIPLIGGFIYRYFLGIVSITFKKLVVILLAAMAVFSLMYLIGMCAIDPDLIFNSETYLFLFRHFFAYMFSGIIGFSEQVKVSTNIAGIDALTVFAPIRNIISVVTSSKITASGVTDYWISIGINDYESNVHTFFGSLVLFLGYLGAIIYVIILSFIIYSLKFIALRLNSEWLLVSYCLLLGILFFSWFDLYFWNLAAIEAPTLCLIIHFITAQNQKLSKPFASDP